MSDFQEEMRDFGDEHVALAHESAFDDLAAAPYPDRSSLEHAISALTSPTSIPIGNLLDERIRLGDFNKREKRFLEKVLRIVYADQCKNPMELIGIASEVLTTNQTQLSMHRFRRLLREMTSDLFSDLDLEPVSLLCDRPEETVSIAVQAICGAKKMSPLIIESALLLSEEDSLRVGEHQIREDRLEAVAGIFADILEKDSSLDEGFSSILHAAVVLSSRHLAFREAMMTRCSEFLPPLIASSIEPPSRKALAADLIEVSCVLTQKMSRRESTLEGLICEELRMLASKGLSVKEERSLDGPIAVSQFAHMETICRNLRSLPRSAKEELLSVALSKACIPQCKEESLLALRSLTLALGAEISPEVVLENVKKFTQSPLIVAKWLAWQSSAWRGEDSAAELLRQHWLSSSDWQRIENLGHYLFGAMLLPDGDKIARDVFSLGRDILAEKRAGKESLDPERESELSSMLGLFDENLLRFLKNQAPQGLSTAEDRAEFANILEKGGALKYLTQRESLGDPQCRVASELTRSTIGFAPGAEPARRCRLADEIVQNILEWRQNLTAGGSISPIPWRALNWLFDSSNLGQSGITTSLIGAIREISSIFKSLDSQGFEKAQETEYIKSVALFSDTLRRAANHSSAFARLLDRTEAAESLMQFAAARGINSTARDGEAILDITRCAAIGRERWATAVIHHGVEKVFQCDESDVVIAVSDLQQMAEREDLKKLIRVDEVLAGELKKAMNPERDFPAELIVKRGGLIWERVRHHKLFGVAFENAFYERGIDDLIRNFYLDRFPSLVREGWDGILIAR